MFCRYGTLSSLERFPSDETDDGNVKLTETETAVKPYNPGKLVEISQKQISSTVFVFLLAKSTLGVNTITAPKK